MEMKIGLFSHLNTRRAITSADGQKIFLLIDAILEKEGKAILDFENISILTSTFMNSAIGQLYSKYSSEYLQSHLEVRNIDPDDLSILRMVIERAKEYFKNRDTFMQNVDEILGE